MMSLLRRNGPRVADIAPQDAVARVAAGEVTLIDVRDMAEVKQSGLAKGALHIPLSVLQMQANPSSPEFHAALSTDKPVVLYCASGGRSQMAGQMMLQMGFAEVYNLGGFQHWCAGGGAIA